jgi:hypothetical protein
VGFSLRSFALIRFSASMRGESGNLLASIFDGDEVYEQLALVIGQVDGLGHRLFHPSEPQDDEILGYAGAKFGHERREMVSAQVGFRRVQISPALN